MSFGFVCLYVFTGMNRIFACFFFERLHELVWDLRQDVESVRSIYHAIPTMSFGGD